MEDSPKWVSWNAENLNDGQAYERKILLFIAASLSKNKDVKDFWIVSNPSGIEKIDDVVVRISFTNRDDLVLFIQSKLTARNKLLWFRLKNKKPTQKCYEINIAQYEKAFKDIIPMMSSDAPETKQLRKFLNGVDEKNYFVCIFTNMKTSDPALQAKQFDKCHPLCFLNTQNPGQYLQFDNQHEEFKSKFFKQLFVFLGQPNFNGMDSSTAQILGEEYKNILVNLDDNIKSYMQLNRNQQILTRSEFEINWFKILATSHWMHISPNVEQINPKFQMLWQKVFDNQRMAINLREEVWPLLVYHYQCVIRREVDQEAFNWEAQHNKNATELKDLLFSLWRNGKIPLPIRSDCTQQLLKFVDDFKTVKGGFVVFNCEDIPEIITYIKDISSKDTFEEAMSVEVSLQGRPPVALSSICDGDSSIIDKLKMSQVLSWTKKIGDEFQHIVGPKLPKPDDNFIRRTFSRKSDKNETQSTGQTDNLEKNHLDLKVVDKYGKKPDTNSQKLLTPDDVLRIITPGLHIITAAPGMGKSTVLQALAYSYPPQDFVIFIKLRDCLADIENKWTTIQTDPIEYFFKKVIENTDDVITYSIFQSHKTRKRLCLCMDGFDEILPCHGERISSLFTTILDRSAIPIVCTTRPHGEEQITKTLNTTCLELSSFTSDQIKQYLVKIDDREYIMRKFGKDFLSNPLHLDMLSQIYKQTKNPASLTRGNMYKTFIEIKHKVYNEKIGLPDNYATRETSKSMKNHRKIALVEIFGKECVISQDLTTDDELENILEDIGGHNIGIVDVRNPNGVFSFNHRTFAEYFVADWLLQMATENNLNKDNLKYFYEKVILNHLTIHSMINELSENSAEWSKAINNLCVGCNLFELDEFGRNFAHVEPEKMTYLSGNFRYQLCRSRLLYRKDALLQWTPMQYCFWNRYGNVAEEINKDFPWCVRLLEIHADNCTDLLTAIDSEKKGDVRNILKSEQFLLETGLGIVALHSAITTGNESIVRLLLELRPMLLNNQDQNRNTALHIACAFGCRNIVELLLEKQAYLDITNEEHYSSLDTAAANGHKDIVSLLVDHIRKGNCVDRDLSSVKLNSKMVFRTLKVAVIEGRRNVVMWLIDNCADPFLSDDNGWTAMHFAAQKGQIEILKLLLKRGLIVDAKTNDGATSLHIAFRNNNEDAARLLLEHSADPGLPDDDGWTDMHYAAVKGQLEILTQLLESGLNVDAKANQGQTPLHIAVANNNADAVRLLLEHSADFTLTDDNGTTAMHYAAQKGQLKILTLLLERGLNVDAKANQGATPLHIASDYNNAVATLFLLEHSADPALSDDDGWTPMHYAAMKGHLEILTLLLEKGLNVDAKTNEGLTPLHIAFRNNNEDAAKLLLQHNADPRLPDDDGWTALHYAAEKGQLEILTLLLESGLNVDAKANQGQTPLHIAIANNNADAARLLLEHSKDSALTDDDGTTAIVGKGAHR